MNFNLKHIFIKMDEVINLSLNEGNIHFFLTINFEEKIKTKNELNLKVKLLENKIKEIELVSWYNIVSEKNKNENYHLHLILAIKSLIGYNDCISNNIKFFFINNFELDTKLDTCWNFLDIKKSWRYLYKNYHDKNKNMEKKKRKEKKIKLNTELKLNKNNLDPIFQEEENNNKNDKENIKNEKKINKAVKENINILSVEKEQIIWFEKLKDNIEIKIFEDKNYFYLKGIKIDEKNYNERQVMFLWDYFLLINNIVIYKNKLFQKIENSMISYKEINSIEFLYENTNILFYFFKKKFKFQFNNFDELNFISKFIKNKNDKIIRFKEFSSRNVKFNFNILEFKDGIYSITYNKFIRTNRFEKNHKIDLQNFLKEKEILTLKFYQCSYENLKEPEMWLKSLEKVLGLKKREDTWKDKIVDFLKNDNIKWLVIYLAHVFHFYSNELNKQNTLYIWGPSNTGKTTLIINLFINFFGKDNIGLISNNKNFEYQHILDKKLLIFDEFDIEKTNIDNLKKLLSKELILGEKKNKEPEIINPTPIIMSSNYNLESKFIFNDNLEALKNRIYSVNFKEIIKNEEMDININDKLKEEEAKIIIYCNKAYFKFIKKGKKSRMDDVKFIEKI